MARRQRGEGGAYQRPDGLWCAEIDVGYVNGKRKRRRVYDRTQRGVIKKLDQVKKDIAAGNVATSHPTVEKWLTYWLEEIAANDVKPKTLADYRSKVNEYLIPTVGRIKLDKLQAADVRAMHKELRERVEDDGKRLSPTTIHHAHRVLANALNKAMAEIGLTRNVAAIVEAPSKAAAERTGLTAAQARAALLSVADDRLASRWLAAFLLGARQGELLGLRWSFVDLDRGIADLAWSLQRVPWTHRCKKPCGRKRASGCPDRRLEIPPRYEHEQLDGNLCLLRPKTVKSRRIIPLPAPLVAALRLHHAAMQREAHTVDHGLVWCREDGRPIDGRVDWRRWKDILTAAEVPSVALHEARHTTSTLLADLGYDEQTRAEILGHSDVAVTRAYTHIDVSRQRAALDDLGRLLALPAAAADA